ncbi:hypothetical protein V5E97_31750 [Singulisphaera sp. Ch08]|uniref:Uncharacterized protein n=1 Tax=Singulisphaera sp. Ch08 TaxID=3120278 RepID=A0AAU7CD24_9BACT
MRLHFETRMIGLAAAWLAILMGGAETAYAQASRRAKKPKPAAKAPSRPRASAGETTVSDSITLRDGTELLGQVIEPSPKGTLIVLARRDWVRANLPDRIEGWEADERAATVAATRQRRERLAAWREERPAAPGPGDRITNWLDRELAESSGPGEPSPLIAVRLGRGDVMTVKQRGETAARALRGAWLLGIADPETTPLATLADAIAGRGLILQGDEPIDLDRLLPPSVEPEARWLLRRAATEALNDEGLRFIRFGSSVLPEPLPGQPPDPSAGAALVGGTIRDVLGVGGPDPLPARLRDVAARGRVGAMVTTIEVAPDLSAVSAESALYYRGSRGWERGPWRTGSLQFGAVPPVVVGAVARDPQVQAVMGFVESIGGGLVSPEMKQRGLIMGTTAGGAVLLARTALVTSLAGVALELESATPDRRTRPKP